MREAACRVLRDPAHADDVVQEVFLTLWRRPGTFDPQRGELGAFLRLMARSRALDQLRRTDAVHRMRERMAAQQPPEHVDAQTPDLLADIELRRKTVRAAVRRLPLEQREAVVLHYWAGMTSDQIAERGDTPVGTVKSRLRLALRKLEQPCTTALG